MKRKEMRERTLQILASVKVENVMARGIRQSQESASGVRRPRTLARAAWKALEASGYTIWGPER